MNFFATANVLKNDITLGNDYASLSDAAMGSAFGSMAAADLVVMALYFATLQTASRSSWLRRLFPGRRYCEDGAKDGEERGMDENNSLEPTKESAPNCWSLPGTTLASAAVLSSSIALASVTIATRLEQIVSRSFPSPFNPPGTMCAFLALLGLFFRRLIGNIIPSHEQQTGSAGKASSIRCAISSHFVKSLRRISEISPTMSSLCFYLLFAAVGTTADLSSAVAGGPTALAFASLALLIHSITVVSVTWTCTCLEKYIGALAKRKLGISRKSRWPTPGWEEVLTASNAAIGGPSTAAAFAVGLVPNDDGVNQLAKGGGVDRSEYRSALVIAATFWGVFGYAIATGERKQHNISITRFCTEIYCALIIHCFSLLLIRCWGDGFKEINVLAAVIDST